MKKLILSLACVLFAMTLSAAPLTPQQALQRCAQSTTGQRMAPSGRFSASDLVYTASGTDSQAAVYVFARAGHGFAVTSADDVAMPLLAYGDNELNADNLPDNLCWWLGEYAREITWAKSHPMPEVLNAPERPFRAPIAPLVKARWNQAAPYNNLCPDIDGQKTYSGCVATAMAQIMKHHNWPPTGIGSHSYKWNGQTLSMDFSQTTFDWDNMTYTYSSSSSAEENAAVALLMSACGISVDMNYGTSGSGAQSSSVPSAMRDYFRYSVSTTLINRDYVPLLDWENYIYKSLAANAPCYYSGQNLTVGHAFICDGYSSDGYFHFNWGWGGVSDGYFLLTALSPRTQGIGGSTNGYNIYQSVILNALPATDNDSPMTIVQSLKALTCSYDRTSGALNLSGSFFNAASGTIKTELGVKVENMANGQTTIYGTGKLQTIRVGKMATKIAVTVPDLTNGLYNLTPMFSTTGTLDSTDWQPMLMPLGEPTTSYMLISGDTVEFQAPEYDLLSADSLSLETPAYVNSAYKLKFRINNQIPNEVYEHLIIALLHPTENSVVTMGDPFSVDLLGNQSENITYLGNIGKATAGDYRLAVCQIYGNSLYIIGNPLAITVEKNPGNSFNISDLTIENATSVNCSDIKYNFKLNNESGYFAASVMAAIAPAQGGYIIKSETYDPIFISGEKTEQLSYSISDPDLEIGSRYMLALFVNNQQQAYSIFKVGSAGIESIGTDGDWSFDGTTLTAPEALSHVSLFTADGLRCASVATIGEKATIDRTSLRPGIYLVRAATATDARTYRLLVK